MSAQTPPPTQSPRDPRRGAAAPPVPAPREQGDVGAPAGPAPEPAPATLTLNWVQIVGGALAAVTAAVLLSTLRSLGWVGTLLGAGIGSLAASVGTAVYAHYLARSRQRLVEAARRARRGSGGPPDAEAEAVLREALRQERAVAPRGSRALRYGAVPAVGAFLLAVAVIAGFEFATGQSLAARTGGAERDATSTEQRVDRGVFGVPLQRSVPAPAEPAPTGPATDPAVEPSASPTGSPGASTSTSPSTSPSTSGSPSSGGAPTGTPGPSATSGTPAPAPGSDSGPTSTTTADPAGSAPDQPAPEPPLP
ncbi:hypothetical protein CLV92_101402 [Kineococcus xinjiangensis]|uniref:Uncharacterized protein n=1 Tax=Kineococcus xinjiangensis TaxID=512762 RepID=A0A2S6IWH1_9ACTN|nr:hypothetical protein [Kineococcus xinjiangensis]PPK98702.1 hypothetical protein CLV92_101402 [Kineococcus xinjiangensis]